MCELTRHLLFPPVPLPLPPGSQHYSAERMSLVLLGGESLDTLQAWVQEAFAGLPSGKGPRPSFGAAGMPFKV